MGQIGWGKCRPQFYGRGRYKPGIESLSVAPSVEGRKEPLLPIV